MPLAMNASQSLIPRLGALGSFMLTSSSFAETPVPVCSCGAGALLVARALRSSKPCRRTVSGDLRV